MRESGDERRFGLPGVVALRRFCTFATVLADHAAPVAVVMLSALNCTMVPARVCV